MMKGEPSSGLIRRATKAGTQSSAASPWKKSPSPPRSALACCQALEQDHFDQLPGGIFNKGFIRAYARCLGLDEEQAIADYLAASGNLASEKEKDKKSDGPSDVSSFELLGEVESRPSDLPWGSFAILLLLVAIAFTLWGFHSRNARKNTRIPVASSGALAPEAGLSPAPTATLPRASPRGENHHRPQFRLSRRELIRQLFPPSCRLHLPSA